MDLEDVGTCPVCDAAERVPVYTLGNQRWPEDPTTWRLWRCAGCGLRLLDPRPSAAALHEAYPATYYTHSAPVIEAEPKSPVATVRRALRNGYVNGRFGFDLRPALPGPVAMGLLRGAPGLKAFIEHGYRNLPLARRLLDVGCGNGSFVALAGQAGWQAVGIDVDPDPVAAGCASGLDLRAELLADHADAHPNCYDAVTMSHVLEHVADPVGLLRAAGRTLRPGGAVWIATPNVDSLGAQEFGAAWTGLDPPRHLVLFNRGSLDEAIRRAGFTPDTTTLRPGPAALVYAWSAAIAAGRVAADGSDPALTPRLRLQAAVADRRARRRPELGEELVVLTTKPGMPSGSYRRRW